MEIDYRCMQPNCLSLNLTPFPLSLIYMTSLILLYMGYLFDKLTCIGSHLLTYHFKHTTYPTLTFSHLLLSISNTPLIPCFFSHQRLIVSNTSLIQYFFFPPTTYHFKYATYPTAAVSHQLLVISNMNPLRWKKSPSPVECFPATH